MGNYYSTGTETSQTSTDMNTDTSTDTSATACDPAKMSKHIKALHVCWGKRAVTYLDVFRTDTIESLEEKVVRSFGLEIDTFRLSFGDTELVRKDAALQDYGYIDEEINVYILIE